MHQDKVCYGLDLRDYDVEQLRKKRQINLSWMKELYAAYTTWCEANGERPRSQKGFSLGLKERGFEAVKGTKGKLYWEWLTDFQQDWLKKNGK